MSRRKVLCGISGVLLVALLFAVTTFFEETMVVILSFCRVDTHQGKPLSHWREVLRADGKAGEVRQQTLAIFPPSASSVSVLSTLAKDPDPHVRWVAVTILGRVGLAEEVVPILRAALKDSEVNVRYHAAASLAGRRGDARNPEVISSLAELVRDPDHRVEDMADFALWEIDVPTALRARGWKKYSSSEYQFTAMFPGEPEKTEKTFESPFGPVVTHVFQAMLGTRVCMITVNDYPDKFIEMTSEEERFNAMRPAAKSFFPGGGITEEKRIDQDKHTGREWLIKSKFKGKTAWLRSRHFWAGHRYYVISFMWLEGYANSNAAAYFLLSMKLY